MPKETAKPLDSSSESLTPKVPLTVNTDHHNEVIHRLKGLILDRYGEMAGKQQEKKNDAKVVF